MMDIHIMYSIVIGLIILDESKSSNSTVEDIQCKTKTFCTDCVMLLDDGDMYTGLYSCKEGFSLTEYVIRICSGNCKNEECFSLSDQTSRWKSDEYSYVDITVNKENIILNCTYGPLVIIRPFMFCPNSAHNYTTLVGVMPQCLATGVTGQPNLKLIISVTVVGSISICLIVIIICCCSRRRRNTWREPYNARTFIAKQLTSDTTDFNSHISTMPTNNVGLTDENGEMQNIIPSQHNNPVYLICGKQEDVNDVYNTTESDNAVNDYIPPVYENNGILRDNDIPLPTENETKCFNNAVETMDDYDTIGGMINPKIMVTGNGEPFMDMLDITDGEYDHLHAREAPHTNDTYSHLKEIHETTDYDPEYAHITSCVQEPVTNANTDEQIEDSTYDLTATQSRSESEHNIKIHVGTKVETDNTIADQNETGPYSQLSF